MMNFEQALDYIESTGAAVHGWLPWVHHDRWIGLQYCAFWELGDSCEAGYAVHLEQLAFDGETPPPGPHQQQLVVSHLLAPEVPQALGTDPRRLRYAGCEAPVPPGVAQRHFLQARSAKQAGGPAARTPRLGRQQALRLCQAHSSAPGWPCSVDVAPAVAAAA